MRIKIVTLVIVLLLGNIYSYSQSCLENFNKMTALYKEGKVNEALAIGEKALPVCEEELGKESENYAFLIKTLADFNNYLGNYSKAEPLYIKALNLLTKINGIGNLLNVGVINNLATLYNSEGNYSKAEKLYLQALSILRKNVEPDNQDYGMILKNLAILYANQGDYIKAEPLYLEALDIQKGISDTEQPAYAHLLCNLAELYRDKGDYTKAENIFNKAIAVQQKTLGTENLDYANTLNSLGLCYRYQDKYAKSEKSYLESLLIRKRILGVRHPLYAITLKGMADLYYDQGFYKKAELGYMDALSIQRELLGIKSPDYAATLNSLGDLFTTEGKYDKAEQNYRDALSIRKEVLGISHPDYAASLHNLATFYSKLGNYEKAESFYNESLAIQKSILGIEHTNYATSLNDLAQIYILKSKYLEAEQLFIEAATIYKKKEGANSRAYLTSQCNLAVLYSQLGKYLKAEQVFMQVLPLQKKILGNDHPDCAITLTYLANIYFKLKLYDKAETSYLESLILTKNIFGSKNPDYALLLNHLANFYKKIGNFKYIPYLTELLPLNQKQIIQQTTFQITNDLSVYLKVNRYNYFDSKFSLAFPFIPINDTVNYELYNTAILLKNLTLRNSTQVQNRIRESKDSTLINYLEEFQEIKKQLNKYSALPKTEQRSEIKDLENKASQLEKKLVTGSQAFKEANEFTNTTWKNAQQSLKKEEAAIEFVSFQYLNNQWTDSVIYAAMVIRPGYAYPKIITLFEQKQLDSLLKRNPSLPEENFLNGLYNKDNFGLYNLIVKPIDSLLQGVSTIYAAPSGSLYNINLSQVMSNRPDGSIFNVHILGTTGELPRYSALQLNKTTIKNAVVFGGVNYDTASNFGITFQPPTYTPGFEQVASVTNRGSISSWAYLPGTLTEAKQVEHINTKAGLKVTVLKGDEANETSFKNLNGITTPYILHLATHGYFFPNPVQEKPRDFDLINTDKKTVYKWAEDPLLRSGLILAGANKAWKNSALISDSTEDGILTSMEVANVDLSNCKLTVLSACETGLGDINGSEGVFGLQRGFKLAGVKNIIMSLWKIPDTQSAELLTLFYDNCFSGLSVHESLKQAQLVMSKKYPAYYWAGFVLLE